MAFGSPGFDAEALSIFIDYPQIPRRIKKRPKRSYGIPSFRNVDGKLRRRSGMNGLTTEHKIILRPVGLPGIGVLTQVRGVSRTTGLECTVKHLQVANRRFEECIAVIFASL